jgi:hypothetical protein
VSSGNDLRRRGVDRAGEHRAADGDGHLWAFIYNLTTDLVGGVEVTLADRD